ncbi:M48 family metalloprotease [Labrenzia sp. DG1229]|uniref:M48 family metalloprotease n=1 Tax=Labrenzia sp. DG1229 TaxID=681847 RepID=UPI000AB0758A|nr:M48 family metalloprotease [Labrenzia sp. DG1229]
MLLSSPASALFPKQSLLRLLRKAVAIVCSLAIVLPMAVVPANAQRGKIPVVRDAETEALLKDYAKPIFKAAGIAHSEPEIILVNNKSFNAFVPDSRRMFINIGVLMEAEAPSEVIGVIAHETGHIAGRHLVRLRAAAANAQIIAVIGMLLGAGAAAAGAASGSGQAASGGAAAALGATSVGKRSLLSYQRGEEAAADRAALKYLNATGQSPRGMLKTFQRMSEQQLFSRQYADPYAQSHPMAQERYNGLLNQAQKSKYFNQQEDYVLQYRHDQVRAKLFAFSSHPSATLRAFPRSNKSPAAQYARAIAAMKSRGKGAVKEIDALIRTQPNNPYYYELKGQALLEGGDPKRAIAPFRKALSFKPNEPQFLVWLGYALVGANNPAYLPEAERVLKKAIQRDSNSGVAYGQLAIAHGRQGERAEADLATAKGLMVRGDFDAAKRYAARAQKSLKRGSPAWVQADDIVAYKPPDLPNRR